MPEQSWGMTKPLWCGFGEKSAARLSRRIYPPIWSSSSDSPPRSLTGVGIKPQSGRIITNVQQWRRHPSLRWMAATLDGRVEGGAVFENKFMLPWSFSEEAAAEKYMPQLQHNMWVVAARSAVLSVMTGGGKWVEIKVHADPLYSI